MQSRSRYNISRNTSTDIQISQCADWFSLRPNKTSELRKRAFSFIFSSFLCKNKNNVGRVTYLTFHLQGTKYTLFARTSKIWNTQKCNRMIILAWCFFEKKIALFSDTFHEHFSEIKIFFLCYSKNVIFNILWQVFHSHVQIY